MKQIKFQLSISSLNLFSIHFLFQEKMIEEDFGHSLLGRTRKRLWNLTEYPESGKDAQVRFP